MSQRIIGLDIGTHAVRATEIRIGRGGAISLTKFGQVALPQGVVSGGEVIDPGQLADAIKRLWREVRFTSRKVIVGLGNQRVIVRPTEVPALAEDDLRSAVELQAADLIPMPLEEVVLDYQILERFINDSGDDTMRVLIVAAQKGIVRNLLSAVDLAGLSATMVDLIPFALLRSLADVTGFDDLEAGQANSEAIISVGGGVTTMVIHERGVPKFVRMLMRGGESFTEQIAGELNISFDAAEGLKRQLGAGISDGFAAEANEVLETNVARYVDEIKSSLDFHTSQPDAAPLSRIVMTGGGARVAGLIEGLSDTFDVPVQMGAPFSRLELAKTGLTEVQLREAEDLSAVAVGLALAGRPVDRGARRLSLMPPEVATRRAARQQGVAMAAAGVVLIAGLGFLWMQRQNEIDNVNDDIATTRAELSARQVEVSELSYLRQIESDFDGRSQMVQAALRGDVAWAKLIQEVATVLPDDVWLDSFSGNGPDGSGLPGVFSVAGRGANHTSSARWLLRIDALESITGLWVPSSVINDDGLAGNEVVFTSDATLTERANSRRVERYIGEILPGAGEPNPLAAPSAADPATQDETGEAGDTESDQGGDQ